MIKICLYSVITSYVQIDRYSKANTDAHTLLPSTPQKGVCEQVNSVKYKFQILKKYEGTLMEETEYQQK